MGPSNVLLKNSHLCLETCPLFSRDRIVVSTLRCGRNNPGSNPGHGMNVISGQWGYVLVFQLKNGLHFKKQPTLPGFEPGIFWSVVRRVIRCATRPLFEDTLIVFTIQKYLIIFCFKKIPSNRIWTSDLWISIESTTVHRSTNWAIEGSLCELSSTNSLYREFMIF